MVVTLTLIYSTYKLAQNCARNYKIKIKEANIIEGRLVTKNSKSTEQISEVQSAVRYIVHWVLKG